MRAVRMMPAQRSISAANEVFSSSALLATTSSPPVVLSHSHISGVVSTLRNSAFSLETITAGTSAGAKNAYQTLVS